MMPAYVDDGGSTHTLINGQIRNVALITSKKGTIRSNHYHGTDWHYMYMLSGSADYSSADAGQHN